MTRVKELKVKLKKLNGLQWTKKQQLKSVVKFQADVQRELNNSVINPVGLTVANYVPIKLSQSFYRLGKTISEITKDMNERRKQINTIESELHMIMATVVKDAYFQFPDGIIHGVHCVGFMVGDEFCQEEIWANEYQKDEHGLLKPRGGSMRYFGPFEHAIEDYLKNECTPIEGKFK